MHHFIPLGGSIWKPAYNSCSRGDAVIVGVLLDLPAVSCPDVEVGDVWLAEEGDNDEDHRCHQDQEVFTIRSGPAFECCDESVPDVVGAECISLLKKKGLLWVCDVIFVPRFRSC